MFRKNWVKVDDEIELIFKYYFNIFLKSINKYWSKKICKIFILLVVKIFGII